VFSEIAIVDGSGNSSTGEEYSLVDKSPMHGINYYRLTQVDFDGTKAKLSTVQVTYAIDKIPEKIKCFPNPFVSDLFIQPGTSTGNVTIKIYAPDGKLVFSDDFQACENDNHTLNLSHLDRGAYYLTLSDGNTVEDLKIVKSKCY